MSSGQVCIKEDLLLEESAAPPSQLESQPAVQSGTVQSDLWSRSSFWWVTSESAALWRAGHILVRQLLLALLP